MPVLERKTLKIKKAGEESLDMLTVSRIFPGSPLRCAMSDKYFPVGDETFHLAFEFQIHILPIIFKTMYF